MYFGDLRARDAAYHQGTVWAWLIGHYVDAWLRVYKDTSRARAMLHGFEAHLREAGIGTITRFSMPILRFIRAVALRRPGVWPKCCEHGRKRGSAQTSDDLLILLIC